MPPATLSAVVTTKPRRSIARASRWHSGASSSTISKVRSDSGSPRSPVESGAGPVGEFGRSLVSMIAPLTLSADQLRRMRCLSARRGRTSFFHHLQIGTIPGNRNMRAAFGEIIEDQPRAAALEQALGDEDPEPHMVGRAGARRNVRFAEPTEKVHREPGSIVGDLHGDRRLVPKSGDADLPAGELNRILDEVI